MHTRTYSHEDATRLAHELQVHQAELESQNEELRRAQSALAAARDRYRDLYENAPVGYLTLDEKGCVQEANRTAAAMLETTPGTLKGRRLSRYLQGADADRWHIYLRQAAASTERRRIHLAFVNAPGADAWDGQIDGVRSVTRDAPDTLRVTLTDISERTQAELERRIAALDADSREAERRRVALELHEDLGQRLSALKMNIASFPTVRDTQSMQACVQTVLAALDKTVATVRRITTDLHPPMLDDLGLNAAMEWMTKDTASRLGLRVGLSLDPDLPPLGVTAALALYRFVQEAIMYLLRDTAGEEFSVTLRRRADSLQLAVRSQGKPLRSGGRAHTGATATDVLQHRARVLGGRLEVDTARDAHGWLGLQLTLPLANEAAPTTQRQEPTP